METPPLSMPERDRYPWKPTRYTSAVDRHPIEKINT
jgi:hypothetical protein